MRNVFVSAVLILASCGSNSGSPTDDGGDSDGQVMGDGAVPIDGAGPDARATDGGGPGPGPTQNCPFTKDAKGFFSLNSPTSSYVVHLPPSYDVRNPAPHPLFVALHGCGDDALNFAGWGATPAQFRDNRNYIAISVGGRENACWSTPQDGAIVLAAMDHVATCFWVDRKRVSIGGYSSGGILAYDLGLRRAEKFAGILVQNAALPGGADALIAGAAWKLNIAHTARLGDTTFPIAGARAGRDKLRAAGFPMDYQEVAGTHGDVDPDWEGWLLPHLAGWVAP